MFEDDWYVVLVYENNKYVTHSWHRYMRDADAVRWSIAGNYTDAPRPEVVKIQGTNL